jgi:hypothetical protein
MGWANEEVRNTGAPQTRTFAELLIDCEEKGQPEVIWGLLREMERK